MRFNTKLKLLLWKYYFDKGFSLTNYFKYILGLFALWEVVTLENLKVTIMIGLVWGVISFLIGWWWYRKDWNTAEIEIQNRINPFVLEMRKSLNNRAAIKKKRDK